MDRLTKERLKVFYGFRKWTRHSMVLAVAGFVYSALGYSYHQNLLSTDRQEALKFILQTIPLPFWGNIFMVSGVLIALSSIWPRRSEKWGYVILTFLSCLWAAAYLMGILFGGAKLTNMPTVLTWCLVAFIWWAISGLVNPPQKTIVEEVSGGSG